MPDYVFDTTVLSNFAAVGRLELLEERYRGTAWVMTVPIAQWVVCATSRFSIGTFHATCLGSDCRERRPPLATATTAAMTHSTAARTRI
jgi:hypothetical protein